MENKIRDIIGNTAIICLILLILIFILQASPITIDPGDNDVQFIVGNETYTFVQTMDFSSITISSSYIIFNNTGFYITSNNDITVSLVYINNDISGAGDGDKVLEFYANTASGNVLFDISGFPAGNEYIIKRNSNTIANPTANSTGFISFSNNVWSQQLFEIYQKGEGSGDSISPEISDVSIEWSNPKDTESSFGWEKITCTVTDNVAVEEVSLNLTYPDSSTTSVSMINIEGTDQYYYDTTFSQHGDYDYYIWAKDTSNNQDSSVSYDLSLPPNWDIDMNGECKVFDLALISNNYNGNGAPGWIREDVDNNGEVKVFDLVIVSEHYGETW